MLRRPSSGLMAQGTLTVQQAEAEIAKLAARQTDAATAAKLLQSGEASLADVQKQFPTLFAASSKAADASTTSWLNNRAAVMELEAAGVHAFDALSSGLSPLRVAATEGARVLEALSIGGVASLSSLVAIVAPLAVVTAGIALLVVHATEANSQVMSKACRRLKKLSTIYIQNGRRCSIPCRTPARSKRWLARSPAC
jgi:hypothetical protein